MAPEFLWLIGASLIGFGLWLTYTFKLISLYRGNDSSQYKNNQISTQQETTTLRESLIKSLGDNSDLLVFGTLIFLAQLMGILSSLTIAASLVFFLAKLLGLIAYIAESSVVGKLGYALSVISMLFVAGIIFNHYWA